MTCCATIRPLWVQQYAQLTGPGIQPGATWTPVFRDPDVDGPMTPCTGCGYVSDDWDEAFSTLEYQPLTDYPEQLKQECYQLGETEEFTFRVEWADSANCGGQTVYAQGVGIRLRLDVCRPIQIKAAIVSNVEDDVRRQPLSDDFWSPPGTHNYWIDHASVKIARLSTEPRPDTPECSEVGLDGVEVIAATHARIDGLDLCDMHRRVDCGVGRFCEGKRYIDIQFLTGDGYNHVGGYAEVTLTLSCSLEPLDCSAEQEDPDYDPPTVPDDPWLPDPDDDPPDDDDYPPDVPTGECICGTCRGQVLEVEIEGLVNSGCNFATYQYFSLVENLNRTFELYWDEENNVWAQDLGTDGDISDPGIPIAATHFVYDPDDENDDQSTALYVWRIEHPGVSCDEDGLIGQSVVWRYQCRVYDTASGPSSGAWVGGFCQHCERIDSFDRLIAHAHGEGCSGFATYGNTYNYIWIPAEGVDVCTCEADEETEATMTLRIHGHTADC